MTQPAPTTSGDSLSPSPTADATSATLASTLPYLSSILTPYPLMLNHSPIRGRYITATSAIPASSSVPLFQSRAFVQGVHSSYLRRQCGSCWRYNHGKGWQYSCQRCKQIYFCSKRCMKAARQTAKDDEQQEDEAEEAQWGGDGVEWLPYDEHFAIIDRGVHAAECASLKRMNGLSKLDKDTAGMLRAIIRIHHKLLLRPPSATPPPPLSSPLAVSRRHMPTPTTDDFHLLIGHNAVPLHSLLSPVPMQPPPSSLASDSHTAFWVETRSAFVKVAGMEALPSMYSILAKLESNAFGLYAAPKDESTEAAPQPDTEAATDADADSQANGAQLEESKEPSADTAPPSDSASSGSTDAASAAQPDDASAIDRSNLGLKSIGRSLYPSASYFNHSCEPNCEVFETGSILTIHPTRDIAQGDEVTIAYIDTQQPLHSRRQQLQATYFFHCLCTRCEREEATDAGGGGAEAEEGEEAERARVSYVEKQGGRYKKRNAKPTKKRAPTKYGDTSVSSLSDALDKLQVSPAKH